MTKLIFNKYSKAVMVLLICCGVSACSSFLGPVKEKTKQTYQLDLSKDLNVSRVKQSSAILLVTAPNATAGYTDSRMAYTEQRYQLKYFTHNRWVAPPAKMLLPLVVATLSETHKFRSVVAAPFTGNTQYRLDLDLYQLRQNFVEKPSRVEFSASAQLINSKNNTIIASKQFIINELAPEDNPYGGVVASNTAVTIFLEDLSRFVLANT